MFYEIRNDQTPTGQPVNSVVFQAGNYYVKVQHPEWAYPMSMKGSQDRIRIVRRWVAEFEYAANVKVNWINC